MVNEPPPRLTKEQFLSQVAIKMGAHLDDATRRKALACYIRGWTPLGTSIHLRREMQLEEVEIRSGLFELQ